MSASTDTVVRAPERPFEHSARLNACQKYMLLVPEGDVFLMGWKHGREYCYSLKRRHADERIAHVVDASGNLYTLTANNDVDVIDIHWSGWGGPNPNQVIRLTAASQAWREMCVRLGRPARAIAAPKPDEIAR